MPSIRMRRSRRQSGSTLLETLIAFLVISIFAASLGGTTRSLARAAEVSEEASSAARAADALARRSLSFPSPAGQGSWRVAEQGLDVRNGPVPDSSFRSFDWNVLEVRNADGTPRFRCASVSLRSRSGAVVATGAAVQEVGP